MAAVVQNGDDTIHWINHNPAHSTVCFVNFIYWIAIYLRNSISEPLNKQHLVKSLAPVA